MTTQSIRRDDAEMYVTGGFLPNSSTSQMSYALLYERDDYWWIINIHPSLPNVIEAGPFASAEDACNTYMNDPQTLREMFVTDGEPVPIEPPVPEFSDE